MASNILVSSQLDAGGYVLHREWIDLSQLAADSMQDFKRRFPENQLTADFESGVRYQGDIFLLEILINNLLENAVKYSPKNGKILFSLSTKAHSIVLIVADQGPGIPEDEKSKIFDRFYRIGNEQVRKTKGTGLGLYLCKKIVTDMNGDIRLTKNHPSGSIFAVHLNT